MGLIFFGIRNDIAQFYGMMFIFSFTTVLMAPNVVDYFRMPGFELKRYVREARDLTNEIKEIARRVAHISIRLAFKSSGWLYLGREVANSKDVLIENAIEMLLLAGLDLHKDREISEF